MARPARLAALWIPVLAYMAFIFALSSISETPSMPDGSDKGLHALLYGGLSALVVRACAGGWRQPVTLAIAIAAVLVCTVYGVSDEFHQSFVPPRQVDAFDVVADAVGAAVVALVLFARGARRSA